MRKPSPRFNLQARRRSMLAGYSLLLGIVALTVLLFSLIWLSSKQADHLAVIANFLTLRTLVLALIAGFVALQAYATATGLPDLRLKVSFPSLPSKEPRATISIRNVSGYSARNPAVILHLNETALTDSSNNGWAVIEESIVRGLSGSYVGITALQWDGGSVHIHGFSTRSLPGLDMRKLIRSKGTASFTIELFADGYIRSIQIPIEYMSPGEGRGDVKMPEWI